MKYNPPTDKVNRVLRGFLQAANILPMDDANPLAAVLAGVAVRQTASNDGPDVMLGREVFAVLSTLTQSGGFTMPDGARVEVTPARIAAALPGSTASAGGPLGLGTGGLLGSGLSLTPDANAYDASDVLDLFGLDLDQMLSGAGMGN